jgi:hypothetical protein
LSPAFDPGRTSYTANVPYDLDATVEDVLSQIMVTATAADTSARVSLTAPVSETVAEHPYTVGLALGDNTIVVAVVSQDGSTVTSYTVVVTRAGNAKLGDLTLSDDIALSPAFNKDKSGRVAGWKHGHVLHRGRHARRQREADELDPGR